MSVLIGAEILDFLRLFLGIVQDSEDDLIVGALGQMREVVGLREFGQPRFARRANLRFLGGRTNRANDAGNVSGDIVARLGGFGRLPRLRHAEAQCFDVNLRGFETLGRAGAGVGRLEHRNPAGSRFRSGTAGRVLREVGGHVVAEHVLGIIDVGHAQGDAQVRVRTEVVLDDTSGALRRKDKVEAEGPPPLRNVDDAVDELRHLVHERRELVDNDDERGGTVGIPGFLQGDEVLRPFLAQQPLAVAQLCAQ